MSANRTPKGTPTGGEFSSKNRLEADVVLESQDSSVPESDTEEWEECQNPGCNQGHEVDQDGESLGQCRDYCDNGRVWKMQTALKSNPTERIALPFRKPSRWADPAPREADALNGNTRTEWVVDGKLESGERNKPAAMVWRDNDTLLSAVYAKNGLSHRSPSEGPAVVQYDFQGNVTLETFMVEGRTVEAYPGGPHAVNWMPDGTKFSETRYDAAGSPEVIFFNEDGSERVVDEEPF